VVEKNNAGVIKKQVDYKYDVFGRRIEKSADMDGAGAGAAVVTRWAYDGDDIVLAFNGAGAVTHRYLHGPAVDQILADEQVGGAGVLWALADNLGSVRDIVNNSGTIQNHIKVSAHEGHLRAARAGGGCAAGQRGRWW
ncbi:MAG: hypothetical protein L0212_11765, partial [Acidobacteria bacterium]|nr:hypothetical protein [Acidobacteriota bacterium]